MSCRYLLLGRYFELGCGVWDRRYDAVACEFFFFSFQLSSQQSTQTAPSARNIRAQYQNPILSLFRHPPVDAAQVISMGRGNLRAELS